jgi:hypothetical protein
MDNKKVVYGVVGGVVLLASAGIIYYMVNKSEKVPVVEEEVPSEVDNNACLKAIKEIGPVIKDANGQLDFEYLLKFCEVVGRHAKAK